MSLTGIPSDNVPLDPKTGRWKLTWNSWLQKVTTQAAPALATTVAQLPTSGIPGQLAHATDGRKPGEGAGAGTGMLCFWDAATGTWISVSSGTTVVA